MILTTSQEWMILNAIPHIGPVNTRRLMDHFGNQPASILSADRGALLGVRGIGEKAADSILGWHKTFSAERECDLLGKMGATFLDWQQEVFPSRLHSLYDTPIGLYCLGSYRFSNQQPVIAIVGSRRTTLYGQRVARQFAQRLAGMGFCIVSGLARGIDTAAHQGALEAGGDTVAILGNGLDIIYPPENLALYRQIAERGAVMSEFCLGRRADRQTFPMRNRIVAGLSDGVLVVESDLEGGSMITARFAAEQGRQVYAIPGRIDQGTSRGCHQLIREGAIITTGVEDILDDMKHRLEQLPLEPVSPSHSCRDEEEGSKGKPPPQEKPKRPVLDPDEMRILEVIEREKEVGIDALLLETGLPISTLNARLMMLELKRLVAKQFDGRFTVG